VTTKRINISLPVSIQEKAQAIMAARDFGDLSGFLQQLIREEYERRHGPAPIADELREPPTPYGPKKRSSRKLAKQKPPEKN
jgi:hypothetical protein